MKIHRINQNELQNLNIPIQEYQEDIGFKDFKKKANSIFGEESMKYMKYLFILYILIDLYSFSNPERKNLLVKILERYGVNSNTINKIDEYLKLGLSSGYILLLYLQKKMSK